jgi:beta-galactosidase GanA
MKRFLAGIIIALFCFAAAAAADQRIYEVGTAYVYYPWTPDEEIVHDIETMAAAGINSVNPFPPFQVSLGNPEPDFSKIDVLLKTAERFGLRVMPTVFLNEHLPDQIAAKYPQRLTSPLTDNPTRENQISYADPEVLAVLDYYVSAAVRHLKDHPCVIAYNIWPEPHLFGILPPGGHDPHYEKWFADWELKKYGSVAAWYAQWNDVYLNHEYHRIDRTLFYWDTNGRILQHLAELVKSIDPSHPTRTHNVGSAVVRGNIGPYEQDGWTLAKYVDEYGLSYYPDVPTRAFEGQPELLEKAKDFWDTPWTTSLLLTAVHDEAGSKRFILPEVETGAQTGLTRYGFEPGKVYDGNRIHLMTWQIAAHDAKGMYFWKWGPHLNERQAFGRGLVASDGSLTSRAVAAGTAARVLNSDPDLFLDSRPLAPQVAVVFDVVGDLKAKIHGSDWGSFTSRDLVSIYHQLWKDQVRVNALDGRQLTAESLTPYKLVIFPFYLCLRSNVAEAIEAYVAGGGTVLADARFGIINELDRGFEVNPGLGMAKLFGARRHDLLSSHHPTEIRITDAVGLANGGSLPPRLEGGFFREELQLEKGSEGKVIGVFTATGTPAVVVRHTGKGQTVLLAFSLGPPLEDHDAGAAGLLRAIVKSAGVEPPIRLAMGGAPGPVEAVVHSRGQADERLVYLLNWGHREEAATAELPWPGQAKLHGKDLVSGRPVEVEHNQNRVRFSLTMTADHAAVVHIQP